jgi:hypothetical protein
MESPSLKAAREKVDAETNAIGATIQPIADYEKSLADQLAAGMTAEEQTAAAAKLQSNADALEQAATALTALGKAPIVVDGGPV